MSHLCPGGNQQGSALRVFVNAQLGIPERRRQPNAKEHQQSLMSYYPFCSGSLKNAGRCLMAVESFISGVQKAKRHLSVLVTLAFLLSPVIARSQGTSSGAPSAASTQTSTQSTPAPTPPPPRVISFVEGQASYSILGEVMDVDGDVGLNINRHLAADIGVPLMLTRSPFTPVSTADYFYSGGLAEPYADVRYTRSLPFNSNLFSVLTGTIPAANQARIFTTGRFGGDLFNHIDKKEGRFDPFINLDASNGSVNRFIMPRPYTEARPYQTLGMLTDFELGSDMRVVRGVKLGASYYLYAPIGPQKVFSRLVLPGSYLGGNGNHNRYFDKTFETVGPTKIDRDNGYSGWLDVSWLHPLDLQLGYTHSVYYKLDTFTIAITFNASHLVKAITGY
jgi:hypothetical protein